MVAAGYVVPGEGPAHAKLMLVGQNPGKEEAKQHRPFVGRADRFLDKVLQARDIRLQDVYITNAVKETTPENRKPGVALISKWLPDLAKEIKNVRPKIVVLMGEVARHAPRFEGILYIESPHPAAAARSAKTRQQLEAAFRSVREILEKLEQ